MNNDQRIKEYLEQWQQTGLSASARERIEGELRAYAQFHGERIGSPDRSISQVPQRTSWFTRYNFNKPMAPIALALILMIGAGGTVAASESARPGDTLFPVERAVEKTRVAFTFNAEAKAELQARYADERIEEFRSLVAEAKAEAEADASVSTREEARLQAAVDTLIEYADETELDAKTRADFMTSLNTQIDQLDLESETGSRIQLDTSGIQLRTNGSDAETDVDASASGSVDVRTGGLLDLRGLFGDDTTSDDGAATRSSLSIEADVFTDVTLVKLEYNGRTETFRTEADTRAEIIAEVATAYGLDRATIDAALSLEVEDRASRPDDVDDDTRVDVDAGASVGGGVSGNSGSIDATTDVDGSVNLNLR